MILMPQPLSSWDYRRAPSHLTNFFGLVEMRFHHVGQASLELMASSDPPTLASQSAVIIGMNHACLTVDFFMSAFFLFF